MILRFKEWEIKTLVNLSMPFHRIFTYWIDKRKWKYVFLLTTLELSHQMFSIELPKVQVSDTTGVD